MGLERGLAGGEAGRKGLDYKVPADASAMGSSKWEGRRDARASALRIDRQQRRFFLFDHPHHAHRRFDYHPAPPTHTPNSQHHDDFTAQPADSNPRPAHREQERGHIFSLAPPVFKARYWWSDRERQGEMELQGEEGQLTRCPGPGGPPFDHWQNIYSPASRARYLTTSQVYI